MPSSLFILGRQPELSAAEVVRQAALQGAVCASFNRMVLSVEDLSDPLAFFQHLGGSIKLAEPFLAVSVESLHSGYTLSKLFAVLQRPGKTIFGISGYGGNKIRAVSITLAKALKKRCANEKQSCRYVEGKDGALSSVLVEKSGMLHKGAEFLLIEQDKGILIARTAAVQAFEEFSGRDYGRPGRNARSGMLPPKLARMMLNVAGMRPDVTILDPFCGSGTVLTEALTLGYTSLIGSDISDRAVSDTKHNIAWIQKSFVQKSSVTVSKADVTSLVNTIPEQSVGAIVTEPYLGPPLSGGERSDVLRANSDDLRTLYKKSFQVFHTLLKPGGTVVFLLPVYFRMHQPQFMAVLDDLLAEGFQFIRPLSDDLAMVYAKDLTPRGTLLYQRSEQRVGREVLVVRAR